MKSLDLLELLLLGAVWGASFLFMRVAAPAFGPLPLIAVRVAIAAAFLSAVLAWRGQLGALRGTGSRMLLLGVVNSALPFTLFAFATLSLPAGFTAVLNATAPLFGALVAWLWLAQRLSPRQTLGLGLGLLGVVILVWHKLTLQIDLPAVGAGLLGALGYGFASHFTRRHLAQVPPLAVAAGSQIAASLVLALPALYLGPRSTPSANGWACALTLGIFCTGLAYVMYFRLLARVGPTQAMLVTYLIPVFGILWGYLFLSEPLAPRMLLGLAVILTGTAIVVGRRAVEPKRAP